jgi:uncharacterized protein YaiE (UPF0345 family)
LTSFPACQKPPSYKGLAAFVLLSQGGSGASSKISGFAFTTEANTMTTEKIDAVSVTTKANVFFDGKCVSHAITTANGTKLSLGVILPATLTFNTGVPEIMECVAGFCEYKLDGSNDWVKSSAGEKFSVPGNSKFDIRVTEPYHYICHFG